MKGVKLQNEGQWSAALSVFESLPAAAREAATARIHMAECKRRLGRWLEAAKDLDALANDTSLEASSREVAASDLMDLRAHIPKLTVKTSERAKDLAVFVGTTRVAAPKTLELDPGEYVVHALRSEKIVFVHKTVAEVDKTIEVFVDAADREVAASPGTGVTGLATSNPAVESAGAPSRVPLVLFGAGALFAGSAVFSYTRALAADERLRESCATYCDEDARDSRSRWNTVTVVAGGLAAGAVAAGVVLLVTQHRGASTAASISIAPNHGGLSVGFTSSF